MTWREAALEAAKVAAPREACGLIVIINGSEVYWNCRNIAATAEDFFIIDPEDYADAEDAGEVVGIFHSHPQTPPTPSDADRMACQKSGLPWYIVNPNTEAWDGCQPDGYKAALIGRQWVWAVSDCWTLVRDWYAETWQLSLPDWERPRDLTVFNAAPMFENCWSAAGFIEVDFSTMVRGDAVLMAIKSDTPNHVGVYLGDQTLLHHAYGRLSSSDVYCGFYQDKTRRVLRHRSRCQ